MGETVPEVFSTALGRSFYVFNDSFLAIMGILNYYDFLLELLVLLTIHTR